MRTIEEQKMYAIIDNWFDDLVTQGKVKETEIPIIRGDIFKLIDTLKTINPA